MHVYVVRRLVALIPTLVFASLIVFVTVRLLPGNVIDLMLSQNDIAVGKDRAALEAALGLDRPMHVQYFRWIGAVLQGDLGRSLWQNTPVTTQLADRLPVTFELGVLALTVAMSVALPIGVYSAVRQDTARDYIARSFSILMLAVPGFWMGTLVMVFPSIWWGWSPEIKFVPFSQNPVQNLSQMLVPAVILGTSLSAVTMRLTRTMMLEVLRQDFIRTARAKGLAGWVVLYKHALRNALIPVVTLIGLNVGVLFTGAVVIESLFGLPGLGAFLVNGILKRDYPIVQGAILVFSTFLVLVNLTVDLLYAALDPRLRRA